MCKGGQASAPAAKRYVSLKEENMRPVQVRSIPESPLAWLREIAWAYLDAFEAIPVGALLGDKITENDLFHVAPNVCLKFRGIKATKSRLKKSTEAMLSSYVTTQDQSPEIFANPHIAFSFAYLASHFAIDLLSEDTVEQIMNYIEGHQEALASAIEAGKEELANPYKASPRQG